VRHQSWLGESFVYIFNLFCPFFFFFFFSTGVWTQGLHLETIHQGIFFVMGFLR
jgi:hypothetical protein